MKIKPEMIGAQTTSKALGKIRVEEGHADMFFKEGRFDLLDGVSDLGKVIPLESRSKTDLQDIAKELDGYKSTLTKAKLIELIKNASNS